MDTRNLTPLCKMTLVDALEYIGVVELVDITPEFISLRKKVLGRQPIAFRLRFFQAVRSRLRRRTNAANTNPVNRAK